MEVSAYTTPRCNRMPPWTGLDPSTVYVSLVTYTALTKDHKVESCFCTLNKRQLSVNVVVLPLNDGVSTEESVLLSPMVAQALCIYPTDPFTQSDWVTLSPLPNYPQPPAATSLGLARVIGNSYPNTAAEEDAYLRAYFADHAHLLRVNDVITIIPPRSAEEWASAEVVSFGLAQNRCSEIAFNYKVLSLTATTTSTTTQENVTIPLTASTAFAPTTFNSDSKEVREAWAGDQTRLTLATSLERSVTPDPRLVRRFALSCAPRDPRETHSCSAAEAEEAEEMEGGTGADAKVLAGGVSAVLEALRPAVDLDLPPSARRVVHQCPVLVWGSQEETTAALMEASRALGLRPIVLPIDALHDTDAWQLYLKRRETWGGLGFERSLLSSSSSSFPSSVDSSATVSVREALLNSGPSVVIFTDLRAMDTDEEEQQFRRLSGTDSSQSAVLRGFAAELWCNFNDCTNDNDVSAGTIGSDKKQKCTSDHHHHQHHHQQQQQQLVLICGVADSSLPPHDPLAAFFPTHLDLMSEPRSSSSGSSSGSGKSIDRGLLGEALREAKAAELGVLGGARLAEELRRWELVSEHGHAWSSTVGLDVAGALERVSVDMGEGGSGTYRAAVKGLARPLVDRGKRAAVSLAAVKWEDLGGLSRERNEILDVLRLPEVHPELFTADAPRRRGVLLFGPPGTGKTLVAKAVATECEMGFMSVKGPELLDAYVGESERNVRALFEEARRTAPTIIFFDELDSLAPARGRGSDGGGVMDRVVSQLLTEMDAMSSDGGKGIFLIGATNRPDLLDAALLRPGRFDRRVFLGPMDSHEGKLAVLRAQTRLMDVAPGVNLDRVVTRLPSRVTGADMAACTQAAYQRALRRTLSRLEGAAAAAAAAAGDSAGTGEPDMWAVASYVETLSREETRVEVGQEDLEAEASALRPALSSGDLERYLDLKNF